MPEPSSSPIPSSSPSSNSSQVHGPAGAPSSSFDISSSTAPKTMTFLGMQFDEKQTKQLWDNILKTVSAQIQKDKDKRIKQIRNFGKNPGDPDYEQ